MFFIVITIISTTALGSVESLWRYPVKSMLGEELNATDVNKRGLWRMIGLGKRF